MESKLLKKLDNYYLETNKKLIYLEMEINRLSEKIKSFGSIDFNLNKEKKDENVR